VNLFFVGLVLNYKRWRISINHYRRNFVRILLGNEEQRVIALPKIKKQANILN
jgi:hypothetical protein